MSVLSQCTETLVLILIIGMSLLATPARSENGRPGYSLEQVYDLALASHPDILAARTAVTRGAFLPERARSEMLPKLNAYGSVRTASESIDSEIGDIELEPKDRADVEVALSQPLLNMKYFPLKEQAVESHQRIVQEYLRIAQEVLFVVAKTYYRVLEAQELLTNAGEHLKLTEEELRVATTKFTAGEVTEDVKILAELNTTKAKGKLIEAENEVKLSKDKLSTLIGAGNIAAGNADFALAAPDRLSPMDEDFAVLFQRSMEQRHDYKGAVKDIGIADLDIQLTKTKFYPSLDGIFEYYYAENTSYNEVNNYYYGGLKLTIPLYDGGLRFTALKEQAESKKHAERIAQSIRNTIEIEIKESLTNIESYKSLLENIAKQVELAEKTYEITNAQFLYGAATGLDLDRAITTLDSAKTDLITKTYQYQTEILNLQKAVGIFAGHKLLASLEGNNSDDLSKRVR